MNKIIITMIAIIIVLTAITVGMNIYQKQQYANKENNVQENIKVGEVIANEEIYDDCTDEWEEIQTGEVSKTLQVNSAYEGENESKYVLRDKYGLVTVFKISDDGKEYEYDVTEISTDYLAEEDKESLRNGIQVTGDENLSQILENFE